MLPLIDAATRELLLANGRNREHDHHPVLKLFNPAGPATWLISAIEADIDLLFGLADFGLGSLEMNDISLAELIDVRARLPISLERDLPFRGPCPLSVYGRAARVDGNILA